MHTMRITGRPSDLDQVGARIMRLEIGAADRPTEELDVGIGKVFKEADKDNSGSIALDELAAFISNSKGRTPASTALLSNMIKALDTNGDGEIDANELRAIAF